MVEMVWEFVVKEEFRGLFELAYGPGGAWSGLFAKSPGFRGVTLLRDVKNPRRYLAFEVWDAEGRRMEALAGREAEHDELDSALLQWSESRTELGVFSIMAEATVRPRGKATRARAEGNFGSRRQPF